MIIVTLRGDAPGSDLIAAGGESGSILVVVKYLEVVSGSGCSVGSRLTDRVDRRGVVGVDMVRESNRSTCSFRQG